MQGQDDDLSFNNMIDKKSKISRDEYKDFDKLFEFALKNKDKVLNTEELKDLDMNQTDNKNKKFNKRQDNLDGENKNDNDPSIDSAFTQNKKSKQEKIRQKKAKQEAEEEEIEEDVEFKSDKLYIII